MSTCCCVWLITVVSVQQPSARDTHSGSPASQGMLLWGKEAVPEAVDHVLVPVDPKEDPSWHAIAIHQQSLCLLYMSES